MKKYLLLVVAFLIAFAAPAFAARIGNEIVGMGAYRTSIVSTI